MIQIKIFLFDLVAEISIATHAISGRPRFWEGMGWLANARKLNICFKRDFKARRHFLIVC